MPEVKKDRPGFQGVRGYSEIIEPVGVQNNRRKTLWSRKQMSKWVCNVCGWIYDPAVGDPDGGLDPGTAFENIPGDWVCPDCGITKIDFTKIDG